MILETFFGSQPTFTYPLVDRIPTQSNKYEGEEKNLYESERRLQSLELIQMYSNAICNSIEAPSFQLEATGSAAAGYAQPDSDLDLYSHLGSDHPFVKNKELRKTYSAKMQILLKASKKIDFPVNIVFVE